MPSDGCSKTAGTTAGTTLPSTPVPPIADTQGSFRGLVSQVTPHCTSHIEVAKVTPLVSVPLAYLFHPPVPQNKRLQRQGRDRKVKWTFEAFEDTGLIREGLLYARTVNVCCLPALSLLPRSQTVASGECQEFFDGIGVWMSDTTRQPHPRKRPDSYDAENAEKFGRRVSASIVKLWKSIIIILCSFCKCTIHNFETRPPSQLQN